MTTDPTDRFKTDGYVRDVEMLVGISRSYLTIADTIDIGRLREHCEKAQAVAPVLEPTAYQRGGGQDLQDQAAFLRAVDEFVAALRKLDRSEQAGGA